MIAPIRLPESRSTSTRRSVLRARMAVAAALLPARRETNGSPGLAGWKAWLWCAWIMLVAVVYLYRTVAVLIG